MILQLYQSLSLYSSKLLDLQKNRNVFSSGLHLAIYFNTQSYSDIGSPSLRIDENNAYNNTDNTRQIYFHSHHRCNSRKFSRRSRDFLSRNFRLVLHRISLDASPFSRDLTVVLDGIPQTVNPQDFLYEGYVEGILVFLDEFDKRGRKEKKDADFETLR